MQNNQLVQQVKDGELLKGLALDVYEILSRNPGGLTVGEIEECYARDFDSYKPRNELAKRVSDLVTWGAVASSGTTRCPVTGRKANIWKLSGNLPDKNGVLEKKDRLTGLSTEATVMLEWLYGVLSKVARKWYLPKSWKMKALLVNTALHEVLNKGQSV